MQPEPQTPDLRTDLAAVLNKHGAESLSGTPDFILADYLMTCLQAYGSTVSRTTAWHNEPRPERAH